MMQATRISLITAVAGKLLLPACMVRLFDTFLARPPDPRDPREAVLAPEHLSTMAEYARGSCRRTRLAPMLLYTHMDTICASNGILRMHGGLRAVGLHFQRHKLSR